MRKLYRSALTVIICTLCFTVTQAQRTIGKIISSHKPVLQHVNSFVGNTTADCDTINYPIDTSWSADSYVFDNDDIVDSGFLNGTNFYEDKQKANYFDLSATAYTYLTSAFIAFGSANSSEVADMSKKILFKVYGDNAGAPGSLLATEERTLSQIKEDVDAGIFTEIGFASPILLPASKKIYVSVDISNFSYTKDTVWIRGTLDGEDVPGLAWEQWSDNTWIAFSDPNDYELDITLLILPVVGTSASSCSVLPVKLISFNAQRYNKDVTLNWQIADEFGMKGYEVERANNNGSFKTVATVAALNNAKNQSYSATDKNAFTISPTVQYRLKQIDGDGSVDYSRVITVKAASSISDISFANPFNGVLKMQLNLATAQPVSAYVYDIQGKLVASEKTRMYNAASNTILMTSTANLQRGMYVLKVVSGTDQEVYKIIKQ